MINNVITQPLKCEMKDFNNLFIELTAKNFNQICRHCYIDFQINKNVNDFINTDNIKKALVDTKNDNLQCIYLTGAEPMSHPDFNLILRTCLKRTNVCICTNGTYINEKKARFLKKVEEEGKNEIIFKLSIDHYNEIKNDEIRSRGAYRTTLVALKNLVKYGFNPILCITNYYKEPKNVILSEFKKICNAIGFECQENNFAINEYFDKNEAKDILMNEWENLDCEYGRILTAKGVYTCPFLANDHRGRCGSDFSDYSKHNTLETPYCNICIKNNEKLFGINFNLFKQ